jgi:hypothetical protein
MKLSYSTLAISGFKFAVEIYRQDYRAIVKAEHHLLAPEINQRIVKPRLIIRENLSLSGGNVL